MKTWDPIRGDLTQRQEEMHSKDSAERKSKHNSSETTPENDQTYLKQIRILWGKFLQGEEIDRLPNV